MGTNLCYFFSKLNFDLICIDKDKKNEFIKKKLINFKNNKHFFSLDITNEKKVIKIHDILKKKILINVIINNAANNPPVKKTKN